MHSLGDARKVNMFWIKHPKPFIQRPVAMQVVARTGPALRDLRVIEVDTPSKRLPDVIQPAAPEPQDVSTSHDD